MPGTQRTRAGSHDPDAVRAAGRRRDAGLAGGDATAGARVRSDVRRAPDGGGPCLTLTLTLALALALAAGHTRRRGRLSWTLRLVVLVPELVVEGAAGGPV